MKKLCKSEQRELEAVCHSLSIMYVPFADLRDGYSCTIDKKIWWKGFCIHDTKVAWVDPFKNHFQYAGSFHGYNTRFASRQNLWKL